MSASPSPTPSPSKSLLRAIAVAAIIGVILFGALWYTVFSAVTAALIAAGGTGVLVVGASYSDPIEGLLEMLANIVVGILAAIGAFFGAIFSIFN